MTQTKEVLLLKWNNDRFKFLPIESDKDINDGILIELVKGEEIGIIFI
jgi:hypothetical protein